MIPYINIHTHHLSKDNGVFLFNSNLTNNKKVYTDSFFSIGIHPWDIEFNVSLFEIEQIIQHPNCLAIGECGLDKVIDTDIEIQREIFRGQLELAIKYQKPVIIHCVKAFDELIEICQPYHTHIPLIIHGFNKSHQLAKQLIDKGFYLSLNHALFSKSDFDFSEIPLQKIFLETDTNINLSMETIYESAANAFQLKADDLKEKIYTNFTTLFNTNGR